MAPAEVAADDEPAAAADEVRHRSGLHLLPPPGVRVLVVDDEPAVRRALLRSLTRGGFEVATAHGFRPSRVAVARCTPDIALVDLGMATSGLELVQRLKAAHGDSMHVAILSGWCEESLQDRCVESGADEYLLKSMSPTALQRHLVAAARKQRAFVEARRARDHAERMHAYGAEAASMLAHDLNNNLAAGLMNIDYLASVLAIDGEPQQALESTRYTLQRMAALVSNFVDIARFEDESLQPAIAGVDAAELIASVLPTHRQPRGPAVNAEVAPGLSAIVDRALIERVLHNLVGNAVRYCAAGASVAVRAAAWPVADHAGGIEITVHNPGPGVPPELAARLFSKYARGAQGRRGVGLYFCRLVCEAHKGAIELVPDGDGPTFRLRLPGRPSV